MLKRQVEVPPCIRLASGAATSGDGAGTVKRSTARLRYYECGANAERDAKPHSGAGDKRRQARLGALEPAGFG